MLFQMLQQLCALTPVSQLDEAKLTQLVEAGYAISVNGYAVIADNGIIVLKNLDGLPK